MRQYNINHLAVLLAFAFASQIMAQFPSGTVLLPKDQVARAGETMTWGLTGPPFSPFSILIDALPASQVTPHGIFGLAGTPALSVPLDGLGLAPLLGVPGAPSIATFNSAGVFTMQSPVFGPGDVGLDFYLQCVAYDPTSASVLVLSSSGSSPSARGQVIAPENVTLDDLDIVDVNPVDPYYTAIGGPSVDIVSSVTFHDSDTPSARLQLTNNEPNSVSCRIAWRIASGGTLLVSHLGTTFTLGSGSSSLLMAAPSFADLSPLSPGVYDVTAILEVASGTGGFSPTGQSSVASIRISATRPTILIHGIIEDGSRFLDLAHLLETDPVNPRPVRRFNYGSGDGPIPGMNGKAVEFHNFITQTGIAQFDIVAHSIGGLLIRRYLLDHPPIGFTPRLVFFGTPHMGTTLPFISAGVSILDLAYAGSLSGSIFMKEITSASVFLQMLNNDWPLTAPNVRVLNIIGTNCAGSGDGIISVNESFLADVVGQSSTVINRYVPEVHGTAPAFLNLFALLSPCTLPSPGLGAIDAATASTRSSYLMLNDFLSSPAPLAIPTPSGASTTPPTGASLGTLWIPLVNANGPATSLNNAVSWGLTFFNWETHTFVWVDAPTSGGTLCLNSLPLGCLFASTCSLPPGVSQAGRTRRCNPITPSGGCSISANAAPYPH